MQHIWVIGCPRSGTTLLSDYIGKHTDVCLTEPFHTHPLHQVEKWKFPRVNTIVFKYCVNWKDAVKINELFENSYFVHISRDPRNVVYSMVFPKYDSYPYRDFYQSDTPIEEKFKQSATRWHDNLIGCNSLQNLPNIKYQKITYENLLKEIPFLSKFLGLNLVKKIEFKNRNVEESKLKTLDPYWSKLDKSYLQLMLKESKMTKFL